MCFNYKLTQPIWKGWISLNGKGCEGEKNDCRLTIMPANQKISINSKIVIGQERRGPERLQNKVCVVGGRGGGGMTKWEDCIRG